MQNTDATFEDFLRRMPPLQAGLARKTLARNVRLLSGEVVTRRVFIERAIEEGRRPTDTLYAGRVLMLGDNGYTIKTTTVAGMAYAEHLVTPPLPLPPPEPKPAPAEQPKQVSDSVRVDLFRMKLGEALIKHYPQRSNGENLHIAAKMAASMRENVNRVMIDSPAMRETRRALGVEKDTYKAWRVWFSGALPAPVE